VRKLIIGLTLSAALIVPATASASTASWKPCGTTNHGWTRIYKIAQAGKHHVSCNVARKVARVGARTVEADAFRAGGRIWRATRRSIEQQSYSSGARGVTVLNDCADGYVDGYGDCVTD